MNHLAVVTGTLVSTLTPLKVLLETGYVDLDGQIYRLKLVWGHCRCEDRAWKKSTFRSRQSSKIHLSLVHRLRRSFCLVTTPEVIFMGQSPVVQITLGGQSWNSRSKTMDHINTSRHTLLRLHCHFQNQSLLAKSKTACKALSPVPTGPVFCQETPEIRRLELENFAETCGDVVMLYSKPGVPNL